LFAALDEVIVRVVAAKRRFPNPPEDRRGHKRCAIWWGLDSLKRPLSRNGRAERPSKHSTTSPVVGSSRKRPKPVQLHKQRQCPPGRRLPQYRPLTSPSTSWGKCQPVDTLRPKRRPAVRAAVKPGKIAVSH